MREGTTAWLDVATKYGSIRNGLDAAPGPDESVDTVEVRARTGGGTITISRAGAALGQHQRLVSYRVRTTPPGNVRVSTTSRSTQPSRAEKKGFRCPRARDE